jgi:hypothetical protein
MASTPTLTVALRQLKHKYRLRHMAIASWASRVVSRKAGTEWPLIPAFRKFREKNERKKKTGFEYERSFWEVKNIGANLAEKSVKYFDRTVLGFHGLSYP